MTQQNDLKKKWESIEHDEKLVKEMLEMFQTEQLTEENIEYLKSVEDMYRSLLKTNKDITNGLFH
jgi:hypothetical protein